MKNKFKNLIFTDLDGTVLDDNYDFQETKPVITRLLASNCCIIFCSNKTKLEIEYYQEKLGVNGPFISENGAAIFVPHSYFKLKHDFTKRSKDYDIVELGIAYSAIRRKIEKIRKSCSCKLVGFGDMTSEEIAKDSGLALEVAKLAKQRENSEPFLLGEGREDELFRAIRKEGLLCSRGKRYYQITGNHDKGKAVSLLKRWYFEEFTFLRTFGLGNELNDIPMLNLVDHPFFVWEKEKLRAVWERLLKRLCNYEKREVNVCKQQL